jgi:sigma-B regulation protein RsbU (phosphoserine phosphatase)
VLYSDGIQDQEDGGGHDYGILRLGPVVKRSRKQSAKEIAEAILADVDRFRGGQEIADDQTLVVMKVQ